MPSLGQLYNDKDAGLTTRKTYNVPLDKIYAEDGYNVRELNQAHVIEFRDAFIAGERDNLKIGAKAFNAQAEARQGQ